MRSAECRPAYPADTHCPGRTRQGFTATVSGDRPRPCVCVCGRKRRSCRRSASPFGAHTLLPLFSVRRNPSQRPPPCLNRCGTNGVFRSHAGMVSADPPQIMPAFSSPRRLRRLCSGPQKEAALSQRGPFADRETQGGDRRTPGSRIPFARRTTEG